MEHISNMPTTATEVQFWCNLQTSPSGHLSRRRQATPTFGTARSTASASASPPNSGSKTFCVLIGKGRRQTIGRYGARPPDITLADAREAARRILAEKTLGKVRPTHTAFDDARDAFLKDCETRLRPITVRLYRRYLTSHFPYGRKSVGDIEPREIVRRLA
jgi:hypothetical protein